MSADRFRLLFFGSDTFSVRVLGHLLKKEICPIRVITKPYTQLDRFSSHRKLIRYKWPEGTEAIEADSLNIGLVASFGNLIDETTVNKFQFGLFNVHPSLLPQFRGSTPVQAAILNGLNQTGCTIMRIPPVAKFDIGDIILQERLDIREREYALELRDRLADLGGLLAERLLLNYRECLLGARPQGDKHRSYAKKIRPEQGQLNFKTETRELVDRKYRAYLGFIEPHMRCLGGVRVRLESMQDPHKVDKYNLDHLVARRIILKSSQITRPPGDITRDFNKVDDDDDDNGCLTVAPGTMFFHKIRRVLCVKCADGKWVAFESATPEARAPMSAADFYNGYLSQLDPLRCQTDS